MKRPDEVTQGQGCGQCAPNAPVSHNEHARRAKRGRITWLQSPKSSASATPARCDVCGCEWKLRPNDLQQGKGCPDCGHRRTAAAKTKPQSHWNRYAAANGLEWLEPVNGADVPTPARCVGCGHKWKPRPLNVYKGSGCPKCAQYGFNVGKSAFVYLMKKPDGIAKVGISNEGRAMKERMKAHGRSGYEQVAEWHFDVGEDALIVEQEVIRQWRQEDDLLPAAPEGEEGYTETIHTDDVPLAEIIRRIETMIEDLRSLY